MSKPSPPSDSPSGGNYTIPVSPAGLTCSTVRDFVVVGGLAADRYAIQWCAIGDPTDWPTPATDDARAKQSGRQTFPTKFGWVTAIAGNDFYMYVFQEKSITKGQYVGGDVVWSFDIFEEDRGCVRHGNMVQVDDKVFFTSARGHHMLENDKIADIGYGVLDDSN